MPDRMPEKNVRQNAKQHARTYARTYGRKNARIECQKIIPYIYIFPDDISETMTNKCRGGDHSK